MDRFGQQVQTGLDKSEQVWSTNFPQPWVARSPNLAHPQTCMQFSNRTSLETTTLRSGGNSASSHFNWRKVWTGVKSNFYWEHFQKRYIIIIRKLSLSRVRIWNFTRIEPKTKKLWLSIIAALRRSYQPCLGQPPKGVNRNFLGHTWTSHTLFESSRSQKLKYAVSAWLAKR